ncbi:MAG: hypothetical protein KDC55_04275 [Ignavibacteriae bacterium]|nr:hypothetical protein [Ignavibacteriota bacterium]
MKKLIIIVFFLFAIKLYSQENVINESAVELSRVLGKEIFELNGVPFSQPIVTATNATANSGFFNTAFIPRKDSLYFKVSVNYMNGFVPEADKSYSPSFPTEKFNLFEASKYVSFGGGEFNVTDTVGLYTYLLKTLLYDGIADGSIVVPERTATLLGKDNKNIEITKGSFRKNAEKRISVLEALTNSKLSQELKDEIYKTLDGLPGSFDLPKGSGMNTMQFAVPQIEIGSYMGTELLLRFIPKINYGETIGDFGFFGVGLKHSISQYFFDFDQERTFDLAVQFAYQKSTLDNIFGETNAQLTSNANILNFNIQGSKNIEDIVDVYTGISFEQIDIVADFVYTLPIVTQIELGLVDENKQVDPARGYPGDTKPQTTSLTVDDFNIKWVIGVKKDFGPVAIFASYNVSKFDIFNGGLLYSF